MQTIKSCFKTIIKIGRKWPGDESNNVIFFNVTRFIILLFPASVCFIHSLSSFSEYIYSAPSARVCFTRIARRIIGPAPNVSVGCYENLCTGTTSLYTHLSTTWPSLTIHSGLYTHLSTTWPSLTIHSGSCWLKQQTTHRRGKSSIVMLDKNITLPSIMKRRHPCTKANGQFSLFCR